MSLRIIYVVIEELPLYSYFNTGTRLGNVGLASISGLWLGCICSNLAVFIGIVLAHVNSLRLCMDRATLVWRHTSSTYPPTVPPQLTRIGVYRAYRQMQVLQRYFLQIVRMVVPTLLVLFSIFIIFGLFALIKHKVKAFMYKAGMTLLALVVIILLHIACWFCKTLSRKCRQFHARSRQYAARMPLVRWEIRFLKSCPPIRYSFDWFTIDDMFFPDLMQACLSHLITLLVLEL